MAKKRFPQHTGWETKKIQAPARADFVELVKKRVTDHNFPPPFMWAENNKTNTFKHPYLSR